MFGIKIVAVPSVPASVKPDPLWVRRNWIGVRIPFGPSLYASLSKEEFDRLPAVTVDFSSAVEALKQAGRLKAARWWELYTRGPPRRYIGQLVVDRSCFELIET